RAVPAPGHRRPAWPGRRRLGPCRLAQRPHHRAGAAGQQRAAGHGLDLERDRQAPRRLEAVAGGAGRPARLPAQPPDLRPPAPGGGGQCRPGHRPGRLVRPAGQRLPRRGAGRCCAAAVPAPGRWPGQPGAATLRGPFPEPLMSTEALLTLAVLAGAVYLFVTEKLPVDVVAMLVLASLLVLGLVTPAEALSGFSSEATITVAAMFILSAGLAHTGAIASLGRLLGRVRRPWLFMALLMAVIGPVSAFVNNTAAVAMLLPLVLAATSANGQSPSQVLIPMSYAAQMGGVCTLVGTSTNLLVNSLAKDLGHPGFGLFEFTELGVITMLVGFAYIMVARRWLLPHHPPAPLTEAYGLGKYITELRAMPGSPLVGQSVVESRLARKHSVYVLELIRGKEKHWSPRAERLREGDVLLVRGDWEKLSALKDSAKLELEPEFELQDSQFSGDEGEQANVLVEAMVAPGSRFAGQTLEELDFNWHYNATVLALHRRGEVLRDKIKDVTLSVGDLMLLSVPTADLAALRGTGDPTMP